MIGLILGITVPLAYFVGAVFSARSIYHGQRSKEMDRLLKQKDWNGHRHSLESARAEYERWTKGDVQIMAVFGGVFWPVFFTGWRILRWFEASAPQSPLEREAYIKQLEKDVERLKREQDA